jgi:hypothetical protein
METKTKTFDSVEESRKWRDATSLKLDAMNVSETCAASVNATQVNMRRGLLRLISQLLRLNYYNPCFCRLQKSLWLVSNKQLISEKQISGTT